MPIPMSVYLAGAGRSGSTIIERTLSAHFGVMGFGEVDMVLELGFGENWTCTCAASFHDCAVWAEVANEVKQATGLESREIARLGSELRKLLRSQRMAVWTLCPQSSDRYALHKHAELIRLLGVLYAAIGRVSGGIFTDSSKSPVFARLLLLANAAEIHWVHVVRHPAAVIRSWCEPKREIGGSVPQSMNSYSACRAAALWLLWNASVERLAIGGPFHRIIYEEFCRAPTEAMVHASAVVPMLEEFRRGSDLYHDSLYHSIAGNPSRFNGQEVLVGPLHNFREVSETLPKILVASLVWAARRYGYPNE